MTLTPTATLRLREVLAAGRSIAVWAAVGSREDFLGNEILVAGVRYKYAVIGEALSRLRRQDPEVLDHISEFHRIIGFRNQLVHHYDRIDDGVTWRTIKEKLPILLAEVEALLAEADEAPAVPPSP